MTGFFASFPAIRLRLALRLAAHSGTVLDATIVGHQTTYEMQIADLPMFGHHGDGRISLCCGVELRQPVPRLPLAQ